MMAPLFMGLSCDKYRRRIQSFLLAFILATRFREKKKNYTKVLIQYGNLSLRSPPETNGGVE